MDKDIGIRLGQICEFVYDFDPNTLPALGNPTSVEIHDDDDEPTSYAGVLRYTDSTVLAFQGTITAKSIQSVKDWLQNVRVKKVKAMKLPGLVHEGFVGQLQLIWKKIKAELAKGFTAPLYVTGHSQGAAVAALATKALELADIDVAETYTFAAPRPGDANFAASVATPVYRFEYGDDIVPHVPFHHLDLGSFQDKINNQILSKVPALADLVATAADGYVGVGPLYYRRPDTKLQEDLDADAENTLARKRDMLLLLAGRDLFNHHHMPHYIGMFS